MGGGYWTGGLEALSAEDSGSAEDSEDATGPQPEDEGGAGSADGADGVGADSSVGAAGGADADGTDGAEIADSDGAGDSAGIAGDADSSQGLPIPGANPESIDGGETGIGGESGGSGGAAGGDGDESALEATAFGEAAPASVSPMDVTPSLSVTIDGVDYPETATPALTLDFLQPQTVTLDLAGLVGIAGKQLAIAVPEGLTIDGYPGIDGTPMSNILNGVLILSNNPPIDTSYTSTVTMQSRHGDVVYDLIDGFGAGQITFTIGVDRGRFYKAHTVPNPLIIELTGGNGSLNLDRTISAQATTSSSNLGIQARVSGGTLTSQYVTPDTTFDTLKYYLQGTTDSVVFTPKGKKVMLTYTYPATATLEGVSLPTNNAYKPNGTPAPVGDEVVYTGSGSNEFVTHNPTTREVKFYYENRIFNSSSAVGLKLKFDAGTTTDQYLKSVIEYTPYDNSTPVTQTQTAAETFIMSVAANANRLTVASTNGVVGSNTYSTATSDLEGLTMLTRVCFGNSTGAPLTAQVVTYNFPSELNIRGLDAPAYASGTRIITVKPFGRVAYNISLPLNVATSRYRLNAAALGLADNETVESITIAVGDFPADYMNNTTSGDGCMFFGNIATGQSGPFTTNIKVKSDTVGDTNPIYEKEIITNVVNPVNQLTVTPSLAPKDNGYIYAAGDEIAVNATLNTYGGPASGSIQRSKDPIYFIVLPKDIELKPSSISVAGASLSNYSIDTPVVLPDGSGRTLIRVYTEGIIGNFKDDLTTYGAFSLDFVMVPKDTIKTATFNSNELVYASCTDLVPTTMSGTTAAIDDTLDFFNNGSGTVNKLAKRTLNTAYTITEDPAFNIFAEIGLPNGPKYTYDAADAADTTVPFTTVSTAEYVLNIVNNLPAAAGQFVSYVPVPKNDKDYGANFQSEAFKWSMGLTGAPTGDTSDYIISYTTGDVESLGYDGVSYSSSASFADVTMIKIERTTSIASGTDDEIVFTYSIEENASYAAAHSGEVNIFHPYYWFDALPYYAGDKTGKDVATLLATGEVKGTVWVDTNANGIMDGTEAGRAGVTVRLRLPASPDVGWDYSTSAAGYTTGSDSDGSYVQTTTGTGGAYEFPGVPAAAFGVQALNPNANLYEFTAQNVTGGAATEQNDSDVAPATGLAEGIQSAHIAASGYIGAGLKFREYTVNFDGNGATAAVAPASVGTVHYDAANLTGLITTSPKKTGYSLANWKLGDSGGSVVGAADTFGSLAGGAAAITLQAQWSAKSYTVSFNKGHSDATGAKPNQADNQISGSVSLANAPAAGGFARAGYAFNGWARTQEAANAGTAHYALSLTGLTLDAEAINALFSTDTVTSATLYAVWVVDYTDTGYWANVSYGGNGNTGGSAPATQHFVAGTNAALAANSGTLAKTGYTFDGWNTAGDGSGDSYAAGGNWDSIPAGNITLQAKWADDYTVTAYWANVAYSGNGSTSGSVPATQHFVAGADAILAANSGSLAKLGCTFNGWNTAGDGPGDSYAAGGTWGAITAGDKTLYAVWSQNWANITYAGGGADSGVPASDSAAELSDYTVKAQAPVRAGHVFAGWLSDEGTPATYFGGDTIAIPDSSPDIGLTAQWTDIAAAPRHTVAYDADGGAPTPDTSYDVAAGSSYTVKSPAPAKAGYTFTGWKSDANNKIYFPAQSFTMPGADVALTAQWADSNGLTDYDLKFLPGTDKTVTGLPSDTQVAEGSAYTLPADAPTADALIFAGYTDSATGIVYAAGDDYYMPSGNRTLVAAWGTAPPPGPATEYSVTYALGGGTGSLPAPASYAAGVHVDVTGTAPAKAGADFAGWKNSSDNAVYCNPADASSLKGFPMPAAAVTLTAQWSPRSYTVDYDTNGGVPSAIAPKTGVRWADAGLLPAAAPARAGHAFLGWDVGAGGSGTDVQSGAKYSELAADDFTMSITLTAQWQLNSYTVAYDGNGHTSGSAPASVTATHGSPWTVAGQGDLARSGYSFLGWALSPVATSPTHSPGTPGTLESDVNLYAVWSYNGGGGGGGTDPPKPPEPPKPPALPVVDDDDEDEDDDDTVAPPPVESPAASADEPDEPESPTGSVTTNEGREVIVVGESTLSGFGFSESDVEKLEAQTGNILNDITGGNVPLGSFLGEGAMGLLNPILSFLALAISAILIGGAVISRRRRGLESPTEADRRARLRAGALRLVVIAVGILTAALWMAIDDLSAPMVWVNGNTAVIGVLLILQVALLAASRAVDARGAAAAGQAERAV